MHPFTAFVMVVSLLPAQTPGPVKRAAETITARDLARHLAVIAADSMMGRDTPSRGLELTARYVADQFKQFGLTPGGDNGTWIQRYPIPKDTVLTAPNTVGILEGSDPKLKNEYVVFSAHMDHVGAKHDGTADSVYNGADDNASGTVGIIELAEAFSRPGARPRRSLIFLTVGGEERGLLGSRHFVAHPPVPLSQLVAAINVDMIGRGKPDTSIVTIGRQYSDLGTTVNRVNAEHPELSITLRDASPMFDLVRPKSGFVWARSDHVIFASKGIPALGFTTGLHPDYHRTTDSPEKINVDDEARLLRLIYYLGRDVANTTPRPQWDEESYRRVMQP